VTPEAYAMNVGAVGSLSPVGIQAFAPTEILEAIDWSRSRSRAMVFSLADPFVFWRCSMRIKAVTIPVAVLFAALLNAQVSHAECVTLPLQQLGSWDTLLIFKGTVLSVTPLGDPDRTVGFRVIVDVERVWKGSVGKRVELYDDLNAENPYFEVGHSSPVFARTLVNPETRRRLGLAGTAPPVLTAVPCTDHFSELAITSALGPGSAPRP
jgi:hypothetical protein